jgi:hypothetical protein
VQERRLLHCGKRLKQSTELTIKQRDITMNNQTEKTPLLRLHAAYNAIHGSITNPEIRQIMTGYGYPTANLEAGKKLYDTVVDANAALILAKGAKHETARIVINAKKAATAALRHFTLAAKQILGKATLASIGITGRVSLGSAAGIFENAANRPEILARLEEWGYGPTKLLADKNTIVAHEQAVREDEAALERILSAEIDRNEKLAVLDKWLAAYFMVVDVALRDHPELKEKIGIMEQCIETPEA